MSKASKDDQASSDMPPPNAAAFMLGTIADTTWRMFIPSIGATLLGVWADTRFGTTPWLTVLGIIIGAGVAGLLVWRQLTTKPTDIKRD